MNIGYIAGIAVGFLFVGGYVVSIAQQVLGSVQGIAGSVGAKDSGLAYRPKTYSYSAYYRPQDDIDYLIS